MTLVFQYEARLAQLLVLQDGGPETYDLCGEHANRTRPPVGWTLQDDRPDDLGATPAPDDLGSPQTVAVLAAALRRGSAGNAAGAPDADTDGDPDVDLDADPGPDPGPDSDADPGPHAVDTAALDAIVEQALADDDLLAAVDEPGLEQPAGRVVDEDAAADASVDALTELSALSLDVPSDPAPSSGRTVPAARRPD